MTIITGEGGGSAGKGDLKEEKIVPIESTVTVSEDGDNFAGCEEHGTVNRVGNSSHLAWAKGVGSCFPSTVLLRVRNRYTTRVTRIQY